MQIVIATQEGAASFTVITMIVVLLLVAWGRFRLELVALAGLLALGVTGAVSSSILFSGFSHPALITMVAVFIMSQAIVDSGLLSGLGIALGHRMHSSHGQMLSLALVTSLLSAFINNVGALALILPTGARMARRLNLTPGTFGMPLAFAAVIGGSMTLVGTGPNMLVSGFRSAELGNPFRMFDFLPVGLSMLVTAVALWSICRSCGMIPKGETQANHEDLPPPPQRESRKGARHLSASLVGVAIYAVTTGKLPPELAFGAASVLLVLLGVTTAEAAYRSLDLPVLVFIGAMLGLSAALSATGALDPLGIWITPLIGESSRLLIIVAVLFLSVALANATNNAAAAVTMAPIAMIIASQTGSSLSSDALLMSVAAGSCLSIILPTHQATLLAMSRAPFSRHVFMRVGLLLTLLCGSAASLTIHWLW